MLLLLSLLLLLLQLLLLDKDNVVIGQRLHLPPSAVQVLAFDEAVVPLNLLVLGGLEGHKAHVKVVAHVACLKALYVLKKKNKKEVYSGGLCV